MRAMRKLSVADPGRVGCSRGTPRLPDRLDDANLESQGILKSYPEATKAIA